MGKIDRNTSLTELAALVSRALEAHRITATLSGGGAVSIYTMNRYESYDLDFISRARIEVIGKALAPLGFARVEGSREFRHKHTVYYVEFPPGPLAFGETVVSDDEAHTINTEFGPIRIVSPTQSVMDRLAAFIHWNDRQSFDQAVMVGKEHELDWGALNAWAATERVDASVIAQLRSRIAE